MGTLSGGNLRRVQEYRRWLRIQAFLIFCLVVLLNLLSYRVFFRVDLTEDQRYSLNEVTISLLRRLESPVYITVYLAGDLPPGFRRLQEEIRVMLDMMHSMVPDRLFYEFVDPLEEAESPREKRQILQQLQELGLKPTRLIVRKAEAREERIIFPGALVRYQTRTEPVHFLTEAYTVSPQRALQQSISLIEYHLARAIRDVMLISRPVIGILQGHGEMLPEDMEDFLNQLHERGYRTGIIPIQEVLELPSPVEMPVLLVVRPLEKFEDPDLFKLDQYLMRGGNIIFLLEGARAHLDSLRNQMRAFVAFPAETGLEPFLFHLGIRMNLGLIVDLRCAPIPVVVGQIGTRPQQELRPWIFFPIAYPPVGANVHPVVRNLGGILMQFAGYLDTVRVPGVKKFILLTSSERSRKYMAPVQVRLALATETDALMPGLFPDANVPLAILVQGRFSSYFRHRVTPSFLEILDSLGIEYLDSSRQEGSVAVIADGDLLYTYRDRLGSPYPTGYYPFTGQVFRTAEFMLSLIETMWDRSGIVQTRNREVILRPLDRERVQRYRYMIQAMSIVLPLILLLGWGVAFNYWRYVRFSRPGNSPGS